jgi:hypothetical protein
MGLSSFRVLAGEHPRNVPSGGRLDGARAWWEDPERQAALGARPGRGRGCAAVCSHGALTAPWTSGPSAGLKVVRSNGHTGAWDVPETVATGSLDWPDVTVAPNGDVTVVWRRLTNSVCNLFAARRPRAGGWAAPGVPGGGARPVRAAGRGLEQRHGGDDAVAPFGLHAGTDLAVE